MTTGATGAVKARGVAVKRSCRRGVAHKFRGAGVKAARPANVTIRSIESNDGDDEAMGRESTSESHAYFLARICPTAMIFTPCKDGITHHNAEFAGLGDLEPGLNVLLHSVVSRADR